MSLALLLCGACTTTPAPKSVLRYAEAPPPTLASASELTADEVRANLPRSVEANARDAAIAFSEDRKSASLSFCVKDSTAADDFESELERAGWAFLAQERDSGRIDVKSYRGSLTLVAVFHAPSAAPDQANCLRRSDLLVELQLKKQLE